MKRRVAAMFGALVLAGATAEGAPPEVTPEFSMSGTIRPVGGEEYEVNGDRFAVNESTTIRGMLRPGATVEVRGSFTPGGPMRATEITVKAESRGEAPASHRVPAKGDKRRLL